jgi:hypothetical protein
LSDGDEHFPLGEVGEPSPRTGCVFPFPSLEQIEDVDIPEKEKLKNQIGEKENSVASKISQPSQQPELRQFVSQIALLEQPGMNFPQAFGLRLVICQLIEQSVVTADILLTG